MNWHKAQAADPAKGDVWEVDEGQTPYYLTVFKGIDGTWRFRADPLDPDTSNLGAGERTGYATPDEAKAAAEAFAAARRQMPN